VHVRISVAEYDAKLLDPAILSLKIAKPVASCSYCRTESACRFEFFVVRELRGAFEENVMVCGGLTEISKNQIAQQPARRRGHLKVMALAIAAAAPMFGSGMTASAAGTYSLVFPPALTATDWATPSAWTLTAGTANVIGYPGGDPASIDDVSMVYTGNPAAGGKPAVGNNTITLSAPLANSIGNLSMTLTDGTTTDALNLQLNANLTVAGNITMVAGSGSGGLADGVVTLTNAVGTNLSVAGTLTLSGANGNGTANTFGFDLVTINGNASFGGVNIKDDADKFIVSNMALNVSLGNVNLGRTLANGSAGSAGGLHLLGGTVTANNFLIGSADSSAVAEVNGSNLTIAGSFIVGDNSGASNRTSSVFQTAGNVNAANSTLFIGSSTVGTVGQYVLGNSNTTAAPTNSNSLTVAGIQMTNVGGVAANKAIFTMEPGTTLNIGAGGIGVGSGTSTTFTNNGGTITATASWSSPQKMTLTTAVVFQSGDANGNPFNINLSGALSGNATLTKNGGGDLVLSGSNTYTGITTVNAGRLVVNNAGAGSSGTGTGDVTINSATLAGLGTISGNVTIGSGSHIAPGNNSVGSLTLGANLTLQSNAILDFDFNISANSLINLTNAASALTLSTGGINVFAEGTTNPFSTNGTYDLIQVAGTSPLPSISGLSVLNPVANVHYVLGTSGRDITLTISGGAGALGWANDISGSWGNAANWNGGIPAGSLAILGNVLSTGRTVTLDGDRSITGLNLNSQSGYTIAQGTGGNLTLNNGTSAVVVDDFAGPHVISAPVIMSSPTTVMTTNPTDTLTVSGVLGGGGAVTISGPGTLILTNAANTFTGGITNNGNLQVGSGAAVGSLGAGTVVNNGVLNFNSSSNTSISTVISGGGNVTQNGTGVLTLSGANTYTGVTNINSGIVRYGATTGLAAGNINVVTPGKLDVNGLSVVVAALTGNGTVDNLAGGNVTLTFNNGSPTFNGTIQNTTGNLTVVSASTKTTLGGNSTYTGGTNVTAGFLAVTSNNALGTGPVTLTASTSNYTLTLGSGVTLSNPISLNDGSINFVDVNVAGTTATVASNITTVGSTQYRLGTSAGNSTLLMTGTSTVGSGTTLITAGNVIFEPGSSLIVSGQPVGIGRNTNTSVLNLTIQDNAVVRGVGIQLGGINGGSDDLTTNVTINGSGILDAGTGVFVLNNSDVSGTANLTLNQNATIRGSAFTMTGTKIGSNAQNPGTLVDVEGGNLVATANNPNFMPASSNLEVALDATLNINDSGFNIGIAQPFVDLLGGGINKVGSGSLSMSGNSTYSQGTTVSAGTLYADNAVSPLGTGFVTVNTGATLGGKGLIAQSVTFNSGSHLAPGDGATTGKLTLGTGVTLPSGSTLDFNFKADGTANSILELTSGSITNSGAAGINLYQAGTTTPFDLNGVYTLVDFDGGFVDPQLSVIDQVGTSTYVFSQSGNNLVLTISGGLSSSVWAVDSDGSWASAGSWTGGIPNSPSSVATFDGIITAARTVTLDGDKTVGFVTFSNANSYTINGGTGGTLIIDNGANPGAITDSAGTHFINVPITLNSNTSIAVTTAGDTLNISGNIGGNGTLTTSGAGNVVLGGTNTFAGAFTATGSGNVSLTGANSFPSLTNSGTGSVILTGSNSFGSLTNSGAGSVVVAGPNTYSGATTISAGKIQMGAGGTLGNGLSALSIASGATLDLNGQNVTVGSLTGAGTVDNVAGTGASVLTTGALNSNTTFSGTIKNTSNTGMVGLVKVGTGNLILSGNNTYSGGTILTAGGLYATNTGASATGNGTVTLNGGILGGTGTFGGPVVAGSGAHTINPGTSAANSIGKLTVAALTTDTSTTLAFDLSTPTGTSDVLAVTGALALNGGKVVVNSQTTTGTASLGYYKVLSYGTLTGSTAGIVLPAAANNVVYTLSTAHDTGFIDIHRGFIGDANDDGSVTVADLTTVLNNLGSTTSLWTSGNFDGGPTIDLTDLNDVLNNLGTSIVATSTTIGATAAPEPASLGILALGAAALIARRRKA
jgi:fibronectin-binding autotransporter adhesin